MSWVLGLKLKTLNCVSKGLEILPKDWEGGISAMDLVKMVSSATINLYLVLLDLYFSVTVKCLFSVSQPIRLKNFSNFKTQETIMLY